MQLAGSIQPALSGVWGAPIELPDYSLSRTFFGHFRRSIDSGHDNHTYRDQPGSVSCPASVAIRADVLVLDRVVLVIRANQRAIHASS